MNALAQPIRENNSPPRAIGEIQGAAALQTYFEFYKDPVCCFENLHKKFGDIVRFRAPFMNRETAPQILLFVGSKANKQILLDRDNFRPTGVWPTPGKEGTALQNLRRNLLCLHGEEHAAYASPLTPPLTKPNVRTFFDRAKEIAKSHVERWPQDKETNIVNLARNLTQHYAFELLFGAETENEIAEFGQLVDTFHQQNWDYAAYFLRANIPLMPYRRLSETAKQLQDYAISWGQEQSGCPASQNLRTGAFKAEYPAEHQVSPEQAAANLAALGMAAYETSALTLSWALFLLTQHPKILQSVREEIESAGDIETLDLSVLDELPLLDGVLKETMRLVAPVPLIGLKALGDCTIEGVEIPKNARVFISPHLTHRMPQLYERPREFRPQRWSTIRPSAYEYLPFSAGPRRCPGLWFANNNLKIALATILSAYTPSVPRGARVDRGYAATTIPKNGIPMKFSSRSAPIQHSHCEGTIFDIIDLPQS